MQIDKASGLAKMQMGCQVYKLLAAFCEPLGFY